MIPVGFTLQPEEAFLDLLGEVIRDEADYHEITPETLWWAPDEDEARLEENGFHAVFAELARQSGKPCVGHGVGLSVGSGGAEDGARRARWMQAIRRAHAVFGFRWYTDHLGISAPAGLAAALPLPLPMTRHAAGVVQQSLRALQEVVPDVGVENTVSYFMLGDPLDEPRFLGWILDLPRAHLLLDLHNVHTMAVNLGFEPEAYLARLDLDRVIEIHLSGGSHSNPAWLPSGRVLRLDGHDDAVPEAVWQLFEEVVPRCRHLRGVTLERMEGTVAGPDDARQVREEVRRARRTLERGR
ncbi:multinuclear nonheme iron-dependent oxidase [Chondromyces apiculatus]|uniref:Xylose isomerase-like TIM barrel domain-containing protein n=1 Tax=Chondromyces apiculatus DSM 436 TaxID=1192034 RepID=A0A017SXY4_9BACT|nr:DUF692 family multinuclear iron-containing protein [Chondromyces apiculatus]EYF01475.1 Hypothetical protein CAP_8308 [Chondromyces apiculatus DSM 436]